MEWWNNGIMEHSVRLNIPSFHRSIITIFQFSDFALKIFADGKYA